MTTCALAAEQTAERSSAASAWHSEPPIVPRLRTTGSAITSSASRNSGKCCAQQVGLQQVDVPGQRADPDLAVLLADVGELGEVVDVDQVLGVGQPQLHHRQQAVAAGDDARLGAEPLRATRSRPRRWSRARTRMARGSAHVLLSASAVGRPLARLPRCPRAARTGRGRRCRSPASAAGSRGAPGDPRGRAAAPRGCRPRRCAAPDPPGWPWRSGPRGRAARASACPWCRPRRCAAA